MTTRYSIPVDPFARGFLAACSYGTDYVDALEGAVTTEFGVIEDIKDFSTSVEAASQIIGLDAERLVAIEVAGIEIDVARDKAMYKTQLASAVRDVKMQQVSLEGAFGIDVAITKSTVDLGSTVITNSMQEESLTTLLDKDYTALSTLVSAEETSASLISTREVGFRKGLADSDYTAAASVSDANAATIRSKGRIEGATDIRVNTITVDSMNKSYTLEAEGLTRMGSIEETQIYAINSEETKHMRGISSIKINNIREQADKEAAHVRELTRIKNAIKVASTINQIKVNDEVSLLEVNNIGLMAGLEVDLIHKTGDADVKAYIAGENAQMAIDIAKAGIEGEGIIKIAAASYELIRIKAESENKVRLATAIAEGQGQVSRAMVEGNNDVAVAIEKGSQTRKLAKIRGDSTRTIAGAQASNTATLSTIVVGQIGADAAQTARFTEVNSNTDIEKYMAIAGAEEEGAQAESLARLRHEQAMGEVASLYISRAAGVTSSFIIAKADQAAKTAGERLASEQAYIAASSSAAADKITQLGGRSVEYIITAAGKHEQATRDAADAAYSAATSIADNEFNATSITSGDITQQAIDLKTWEATARQDMDIVIEQYNRETNKLSKYSKAYNNNTEGGAPAGEIWKPARSNSYKFDLVLDYPEEPRVITT